MLLFVPVLLCMCLVDVQLTAGGRLKKTVKQLEKDIKRLEGIIAEHHPCEPNWHNVADKCVIISDDKLTWVSAKGRCETMGGQLAPVDDTDTQSVIAELTTEYDGPSEVTIDTPDNYNYQYLDGVDLTGSTSVIFSVQACNDAHVALSAIEGVDTDRTTEIVIGGWGNSQSVIRSCKQCTNLVVDRSSPLHCDQLKPFWISWVGNHIQVGRGHSVGLNGFMSWNAPDNYDVNYIAVATGWGSTGEWTFPRDSKVYAPGQFWIGHNDNCMVVDLNNNFQSREEDCSEKFNYICERPTETYEQ